MVTSSPHENILIKEGIFNLRRSTNLLVIGSIKKQTYLCAPRTIEDVHYIFREIFHIDPSETLDLKLVDFLGQIACAAMRGSPFLVLIPPLSEVSQKSSTSTIKSNKTSNITTTTTTTTTSVNEHHNNVMTSLMSAPPLFIHFNTIKNILGEEDTRQPCTIKFVIDTPVARKLYGNRGSPSYSLLTAMTDFKVTVNSSTEYIEWWGALEGALTMMSSSIFVARSSAANEISGSAIPVSA